MFMGEVVKENFFISLLHADDEEEEWNALPNKISKMCAVFYLYNY